MKNYIQVAQNHEKRKRKWRISNSALHSDIRNALGKKKKDHHYNVKMSIFFYRWCPGRPQKWQRFPTSSLDCVLYGMGPAINSQIPSSERFEPIYWCTIWYQLTSWTAMSETTWKGRWRDDFSDNTFFFWVLLLVFKLESKILFKGNMYYTISINTFWLIHNIFLSDSLIFRSPIGHD